MSDPNGDVAVLGGFGGFGSTDRPAGAADVETAVFDGEVVLFHESRHMVHQLNATSGTVWLLCDGETDVASMAVELSEVFHLPPEALTEGIYQALDQLAAAGLIDGVEPAEQHHRRQRPELLAPDGSRMMVAPPDP